MSPLAGLTMLPLTGLGKGWRAALVDRPIAWGRVFGTFGRIVTFNATRKFIAVYSTISANVVGQGWLCGLARLLSRHPATTWPTTSYGKLKSPIIPSLTLKSKAGKEVTTVYGDEGVISRRTHRLEQESRRK